MKVDIYNLKNEKVGTTELPDAVFGVPWKPALVQQVLLAQQANRRRPWAHAKDRSEVSGGGKKPWRQKGTGRARHGSTRSPIWRHGGKAHGPRNERDYTQKVNVKMKRLALLSTLSRKTKDGGLKVIDHLAAPEPKTRTIAAQMATLVARPKHGKRYDALLVPASGEKNIFRAARNLTKMKVLGPESLNVYDVMNHKYLLLDREAVAFIEKHYRMKK